MNISTATLGYPRTGIGDVTLYDRILDWAVRFGLILQRFQDFTGLELTIAMTRGKEGNPILKNMVEATKKLREGINATQE